jgi:hypothetical protein
MAISAFRVRVDGKLVEAATSELQTALAAQNFAYAQRFEQRWLPPEGQRLARTAALVLCALGAGLSAFLVAAVPAGCSTAALGRIFFASFGILALAFYRIFDAQAWIRRHARRWTGRRLKSHATKNFAPMRDAVPLEIEYAIDGNEISARWIRAGRPDKSWRRTLGGYAYVGTCVCAIFRKRRSFYPSILVLHTDRSALVRTLEAHGVEVGDDPGEIPCEYGLVPLHG